MRINDNQNRLLRNPFFRFLRLDNNRSVIIRKPVEKRLCVGFCFITKPRNSISRYSHSAYCAGKTDCRARAVEIRIAVSHYVHSVRGAYEAFDIFSGETNFNLTRAFSSRRSRAERVEAVCSLDKSLVAASFKSLFKHFTCKTLALRKRLCGISDAD